MPLLFFGHLTPSDKKPRLYDSALVLETSGVFESFTEHELSPPKSRKEFVAKQYHLKSRNTTALVWVNAKGQRQAVFLNGLLNSVDAIVAARMHFPSIIPNPTVFRLTSKIHVR